MPVVGRSLERLVAEAVRSRLEVKFQDARSWLSGNLTYDIDDMVVTGF